MALFRCASGGGGGGQITVTYDSDFYGETITCTRGQKVYSKVATSSGSVVFVVNEEGDWLIECTIGQDTYSTTASIEFTTSTELVSIPDGSTVLPTDDVETWLACAGIRDKAYTTLSQVLADSETFNALLGDSNACAYMARSTTWTTDLCASQYAMSMIGQYDVCCDALLGNATWASAIVNSAYADYVLSGRGLVPTLSSGTGSNGVVNECGETYRSYDATNGQASWCAFDGNLNHYAAIQTGSTTAYLGYTFNDATKVGVIYYDVSTLGTLSVTYKITAQYSDDDSTWNDASSEVTLSGTTNKAYIISTETSAHRYWRIKRVTSQTQSTVVGELQFYGDIGSREYIHGTNNESAYYLDGATQTPIVDPSTLSAGTYTFGSTVAKNPSDLTADYTKTIRITPNTKEIVLRPDKTLYWWGYMSKGCEELLTANGWSQGNNSLISPTYDDYDVLCSVPSASQTCGIGSKYAVDLTSVSCISQGITIQSSEYGQYAAWTDKSGSAAAGGIAEWVTSSNMETHTVSSVSQVTGYPIFIALNKRAIKFFACWYE